MMNYYSLNQNAPKVSFKEAVIHGIAPDKGLYFPERITPLPRNFFAEIEGLSNYEIAFKAIQPFVGDAIPSSVLNNIISKVLDFDFPVVTLEPTIATLELFHGPTMAFKDVGARFMANCLGYFSQESTKKVTVLVATSGDTGGAVANGFLGVDGVEVVILYPSGKVSPIQEKQLTTLGQNITALEVDGSFDDCQRMVKKAFLDTTITKSKKLTSANSINVARWLPQLFYYLFAYKQVKHNHQDLVFSVPSGNFGNICAGMVAQKLGMPVKHFIAATNSNDTIPLFTETKNYRPKPSKPTISNAMDVGDPSNFIRILNLFDNNADKLLKGFSSYSFSDSETKEAIRHLYKNSGYIADPHGAVGYLGLREYLKDHNGYGIFLETAHPIKFLETVENTLGIQLPIPEKILELIKKPKKSIPINSYNQFAQFLLS